MNRMTMQNLLRCGITGGMLCWLAASRASDQKDISALRPFLDDQTFILARVDLAQVEVEALFAKGWDILHLNTELTPLAPEATNDFIQAKAEVKAWLADFRQAGARELFIIGSGYDIPDCIIVVSLSAQADRAQLIRMLSLLEPFGRDHKYTFEASNSLLLGGMPATLERVRALQIGDLRKWDAPMAAVPEATVQVLLRLTPDQIRVIEEMMPQLRLPGLDAPATLLTHGIIWAALGVNLPPEMAVQLTLQSRHADAAQEFKGFLEKLTSLLADVAPIKQQIPGLAGTVKLLIPAVKDTRLIMSLDGHQIDELIAKAIKPSLDSARLKAQRIMSMNNVKQIILACHMYANDHRQEWPVSLEALLDQPSYLGNGNVLADPRHPTEKIGYVYLPPARDRQQSHLPAAEHIVVYGKPAMKPEQGLVVGFLDGHVEWIVDESRFKGLLAESQRRNAAP